MKRFLLFFIVLFTICFVSNAQPNGKDTTIMNNVRANNSMSINNTLITGGVTFTELNSTDIGSHASPLYTIHVSGIDQVLLQGSLTDNAPTKAEIIAIVGSPSVMLSGYSVSIKDSDGSGLIYKVISDGTDWFWVVTTKSL